MQKKIINTKLLNNNLIYFDIINGYYLNKLFKDKKINIHHIFLNNNYKICFKKNKNIKRSNFFNNLNFKQFKKKKIKNVNNFLNTPNLYNIYLVNNKNQIKNKKNYFFLKNNRKFNKLLFLKKEQIKKYSLFFNFFKKKLSTIINKNGNIKSYNTIKIIIYKLLSLVFFLKKKQKNINQAKNFAKNFYFKSKKQKKSVHLSYKKSNKNNQKNTDYSFIKFYRNIFYYLVSKLYISTNKSVKKKQVLSFVFFLFKFSTFDYYTKNKRLITKNKFFLNFKKTKKIKRRVGNNFFYKKKLYLDRLQDGYYSSLTKFKYFKKKKIKKTKISNCIYKKKNKKNNLYYILKNKKSYSTNPNIYKIFERKKLNLKFNVKHLIKKTNTVINSNINKNSYNNKIINFYLLHKKLLIINNMLKNLNKYSIFNFKIIYSYLKYFFINYKKIKYSLFKKKNIIKKKVDFFYYDMYLNNLLEQYEKNIMLTSNNILLDIILYNKHLNKLSSKETNKKIKVNSIICIYLNLIQYLNNNYYLNNEFLKNVTTIKKNIKNKYIKKKPQLSKKKPRFFKKKKNIFKKNTYSYIFYKFKRYLYLNNKNIRIKYKYQVKSNLNYNTNYLYNLYYVNSFYKHYKPLHIYYNITTKNTRYLISNDKFKILKSNSLGLLKISRKDMRQKKSKLKLAESFLKHFKLLIKKNKQKFNEIHFHLIRHKYFTYLIFKLFRKYVRKKIKKIEKKKKKYFIRVFINMISFLKRKKKTYKKKYKQNIYNSRYFLNNLIIQKKHNKFIK